MKSDEQERACLGVEVKSFTLSREDVRAVCVVSVKAKEHCRGFRWEINRLPSRGENVPLKSGMCGLRLDEGRL